jgi:phytoene synthase
MTPFHLRQRLARLMHQGAPDDSIAYCRQLVRRSRSNFSYAFMFLPLDQEDALEAVYAFCRVVDDAVDEPIGRGEVGAWREELLRAFGQGGGAPQTPIGIALAESAARFPIRLADLERVVEGVSGDLGRTRYASWAELRDYCERVASAVGLVCIEIFGHSTARSRRYATELGVALQLTNILRDVAADARRGRIYLPLEDLARFGVSEDDVLERRCTRGFQALMRFEIVRARTLYQTARASVDEADRQRLFVAEIMADIYLALLDQIERSQRDIMAVAPRLRRRRKLALAMKRWLEVRLAA